MKEELVQLKKAIIYNQKRQQEIVAAQVGLLSAKIVTLLERGQCKPVIKALEAIQLKLGMECNYSDLVDLGKLLESL